MFDSLKRKGLPLLLALVMTSPGMQGQKKDYKFDRPVTPQGITTNRQCVLDFSGNEVRNLKGTKFAHFGKEVTDISVNPTALSVLILAKDNKKPIAALFSVLAENDQLQKFNRKKFDGVPVAIGYTADARKMLIATADSTLRIYNPQQYNLLETMKLGFAPTAFVVSDNGYFLALTNGKDVAVLNFENGNVRKTWDFGEGVTDMTFSRDNDEFVILTSDGVATIYDTRNFMTKKTIDDLGDALGADYNFDGKYLAVVTAPNKIEIINVLDDLADREIIEIPEGGASELAFINDADYNQLLAYNAENAMKVKRMTNLAPYYGKLINQELEERMNEWMRMLPGESLEDYQKRVNDSTREAQRKLFEAEISTAYANNLVNMASISLGNYDRANGVLAVEFDNMPSIFLSVPEEDVMSFTNSEDLTFNNAKYGVLPNDRFELIYAEVFNEKDGKTYIYSNLDRVNLNYMNSDENVVALELIQQQKMEELRLQAIREEIMKEAKQSNVLSDHTNITIDSRLVPDYDADGNRILNYLVNISYEVDPGFSAIEDFAPGKYRIEESGAANAMMRIVKEAFEGDLAQYVRPGKKLRVKLTGTADSTPIMGRIAYDGIFGEFVDEPVYQNGQMTGLTVTSKDGIKTNEQLAFIRSCAVRDFLKRNVENIDSMNTDFTHNIVVSEGKGGEFRRITAEFTFVDAL